MGYELFPSLTKFAHPNGNDFVSWFDPSFSPDGGFDVAAAVLDDRFVCPFDFDGFGPCDPSSFAGVGLFFVVPWFETSFRPDDRYDAAAGVPGVRFIVAGPAKLDDGFDAGPAKLVIVVVAGVPVSVEFVVDAAAAAAARSRRASLDAASVPVEFVVDAAAAATARCGKLGVES